MQSKRFHSIRMRIVGPEGEKTIRSLKLLSIHQIGGRNGSKWSESAVFYTRVCLSAVSEVHCSTTAPSYLEVSHKISQHFMILQPMNV